MIQRNVTRYEVGFYGGPDPFRAMRAIVKLYEGEEGLGSIYFADLDKSLADSRENSGRIETWMPLTMLSSVVDLLRNEEPVTFGFDSGAAWLNTSREKVGEAE